MARVKKPKFLPTELAKTLEDYMVECGYSKGTISMKSGNLNFLFSHYGKEKMMEMLYSSHDRVWEQIQYIEESLPPGCIVTADLHAFKLAWESIHRVDIINKRVKRKAI